MPCDSLDEAICLVEVPVEFPFNSFFQPNKHHWQNLMDSNSITLHIHPFAFAFQPRISYRSQGDSGSIVGCLHPDEETMGFM